MITDISTSDLAHEACNYAAHNKICPLAIAQSLRAQTERDAERTASLLAVEFALESALERLANAVTAHLGNGISIETLNELCDAEDAALEALQLSRGGTK